MAKTEPVYCLSTADTTTCAIMTVNNAVGIACFCDTRTVYSATRTPRDITATLRILLSGANPELWYVVKPGAQPWVDGRTMNSATMRPNCANVSTMGKMAGFFDSVDETHSPYAYMFH